MENKLPVFKTWMDIVITIATISVLSLVFVQNQGNDKFYSKEAGKNIKNDQEKIQKKFSEFEKEVRKEFKEIKNQNTKIISSLSNIEGRLEGAP